MLKCFSIVLQCFRCVSQCVAVFEDSMLKLSHGVVCCSVSQCVAVQCVAVYDDSMLNCSHGVVCCSVLQYFCSVSRCVAVNEEGILNYLSHVDT